MESRQDHNKELQSFHTYRTLFTELSIQDLHIFNHLRPNGGNGPHNSQINKLENGTLNPKKEIFDALHSMNQEIAKKDNKFLYIPQERIRSRLKKAPAYLNHEGKVATKKDFLLIFHGLQPVYKSYKEKEILTQEFLDLFGVLMKEEFDEFARERLLNTRDAYEELKATKAVSKADEEVQKRIADLIRGEGSPNPEFAYKLFSNYKSCPCYDGLKELSDRKNPKLDSMHNKLVELALS